MQTISNNLVLLQGITLWSLPALMGTFCFVQGPLPGFPLSAQPLDSRPADLTLRALPTCSQDPTP